MTRLLAALLLCPTLALAQDLPAGPGPMLRIEPLPRIAQTYHSDAANRINARLFALDQKILQSVADCGTIPPEDLPPAGSTPPTERIFWDRQVQITMSGPTFLSIVITDVAYCPGAAHGFTEITPLIFGLKTGDMVDPLTWLPPDLQPATPRSRQVADWAALTAVYLSHRASAEDAGDCDRLLRTGISHFSLWPDQGQHALVLLPEGRGRTEHPCAVRVALTRDQLRQIGADPGLIADLSAP